MWSVHVCEETLPENSRGATNGQKQTHLMKSTTMSISRDLNDTLIIFTTGFPKRRTLNLQASVAFSWTHLAEWFVFGAYISGFLPDLFAFAGFQLAVRSTTRLRCLFLVMLLGVGIVIELLFGRILPFGHSIRLMRCVVSLGQTLTPWH